MIISSFSHSHSCVYSSLAAVLSTSEYAAGIFDLAGPCICRSYRNHWRGLTHFWKICPSVYDKLHRTVSRNVHLAAWSSWPPSGDSGRLETGPFTGPEQDPHWTLSSNQWRLDTSDVIRSIHRGHLPIDMKLGVGLDCSLANFQRSKVINRMRYIHAMVKGRLSCLSYIIVNRSMQINLRWVAYISQDMSRSA